MKIRTIEDLIDFLKNYSLDSKVTVEEYIHSGCECCGGDSEQVNLKAYYNEFSKTVEFKPE